ncbi:MAG: PucR family transcriptional regulator ligand-binding domain-containing protein [Chloroflexota bacterium]|nr:PucR family transcriptional regulator ligand-binding domain-containing protein [Chloroflexota bacterium]
MAITVRKALSLGGLAKAKLVAGKAGLDRPIRWVDIMEVPDAAAWLRGDELLLTTVYAIKDQLDAQLSLVRELHRVGAAALAIKPGRFISAIPKEVIVLANELGFPVIELALDTPYVDIVTPILRAILDERSDQLAAALRIHKDLTAVLLSGGGLQALADTLAAIIRRPVFLRDAGLSVVAASSWGASDDLNRVRALQDSISCPAVLDRLRAGGTLDATVREGKPVRVPPFPDLDSAGQLIMPVFAGGQILGQIVAVEMGEGFREQDSIALEHAAAIAGLELMRLRAVYEAEGRLARDLFEDMLAGKIGSPSTIEHRARFVGWDLSSSFVPMVIDVDGFEQYCRDRRLDEPAIQDLKRWLLHVVTPELTSLDPKAVIVNRSDSITALLHLSQADSKQRTLDVATSITRRVAASIPGLTVSVGIGTHASDLADVAESHTRAQQAVRAARAARGSGSVLHYNDLGLYRLLLPMAGSRDLREFCRDALEPLLASDRDEGTEYVKSLRYFLAHNGNLNGAARALFVHRNTLRHRLERIGALLKADLSDNETRLRLQLALAALDFLQPLYGLHKGQG